MAKLKRLIIFPSTFHLPDKVKQWADRLITVLDRSFIDIASIPFNQSESVEVSDTGNADTEFTVTHHLGRTPTGFIVTNTDKAAQVYDSGTAWTSTSVYLKSATANCAVTVTVF